MLASAIRELSASKNPAHIAAAFFENTVQVWDVRSRDKIIEFPTVFCAGAKNLAFAPGGKLLVAAKSTGLGIIAGYNALTGELLWEHRRIGYPSRICFDATGDRLWCTVNRKSIEFLDPKTGSTVDRIYGVSEYAEGPDAWRLTVPAKERGSAMTLRSQDSQFDIEKLTFALLDLSFAADCVCLTEAGGPVRCISFADGEERWRFFPKGSHIVQLCYSANLNVFFGISSSSKEARRKQLLQFDAESGACREICTLDGWEHVFLSRLEQIVTSSGEIRSLRDGDLLGRLPFPSKEYPDA